jgi:AAA+ superfamily predicted ATPase
MSNIQREHEARRVSRCFALIKFHPPNDEARRKIWEVMTDQFGLVVDAPLLDALVGTFPATSGRDIKGLAKLVAKYCQHRKATPTLDVFERCAVFRGIDLGSAAGG